MASINQGQKSTPESGRFHIHASIMTVQGGHWLSKQSFSCTGTFATKKIGGEDPASRPNYEVGYLVFLEATRRAAYNYQTNASRSRGIESEPTALEP